LACIFLAMAAGAAGYFLGLHNGRSDAIESGAEAVLAAAKQKSPQDPAARLAADEAADRLETQQAAADADKARRKIQQGRINSAQRLSDIGKAMLKYNAAHPDGPLPKSLKELAANPQAGNLLIKSPITGKDFGFTPKPPGAKREEVLAYDDLLPDGGNILFADAHVEWWASSEFKKVVEKGSD
jgi:prepilin-type processing-associated H-X9-DG protein